MGDPLEQAHEERLEARAPVWFAHFMDLVNDDHGELLDPCLGLGVPEGGIQLLERGDEDVRGS